MTSDAHKSSQDAPKHVSYGSFYDPSTMIAGNNNGPTSGKDGVHSSTHSLRGDCSNGDDGPEDNEDSSIALRKWQRGNGSTTQYLVLPLLANMRHYDMHMFRGDFIASLTVASLYIPMSFSFSILGQVPPASGLYAFVIHPFIYALLGTSSQMVVGPEATGSLLVGSVVQRIHSSPAEDEGLTNAQISATSTAMAGLLLLSAGFFKLGFIENVLIRPFMVGFVAAVGFAVIVEQAFPELGLSRLAEEEGRAQGSTVIKLGFLLTNLSKCHLLTATIAIGTMGFVLSVRSTQKRLRNRFPSITLFPDRLIAIVATALLSWCLDLQKHGLMIVGFAGSSGSDNLPQFQWPFRSLAATQTIFSTAVMIALLGYLESSVTSKTLKSEGRLGRAIPLSANRELIALGTANIGGSFFSTLPAFGGFGRSKLNKQTGGTTPISSLLLSLFSLIFALFLMPWLYYVPKATLCGLTSVVGISMMEEAPPDIAFYVKVRSYREVGLMIIIFAVTVCHSMSAGIVIGGGVILIEMIRQATKSNIEVLLGQMIIETAPDPDTLLSCSDLDGCILVRIPGPLSFVNCGDFATKIRRLESLWTRETGRSLEIGPNASKILIIDAQRLAAIDGCGLQVLAELGDELAGKDIKIILWRVWAVEVLEALKRSGILEKGSGFVFVADKLADALQCIRAGSPVETFI